VLPTRDGVDVLFRRSFTAARGCVSRHRDARRAGFHPGAALAERD
jgi:hypothetical protein